MRWCIRFVGLGSTVVLARLLTPEDFGIAAMGMMVIGFLTRFSQFGTSQHLIRSKEIDKAHRDTAWSIDVLQGLFVAVMLVALAVPATKYFREPRVEDVMYILAVSAFLGGLTNIGHALARRNLKFALDFRFNVYRKMLVFFTTLGCALILRDYWALVIGSLVGTVVGVALSYIMFPERPAWSLARAPEYLRFSAAVLPMRIGRAILGQLPLLVVGGLGNATAMGAYHVSSNLASTFTQEIVIPMGRGLYPNYVRLAREPRRLSEIYRTVLGLVTVVCMPLGVGLSAVANDVVAVILGGQWAFAVPIMEYLALAGVLGAISHTLTAQILISTGRERDAAILSWVRVGITAPILVIGAGYNGILGVAQGALIAPLVHLPIMYVSTSRAVDLPLTTFLGLLWRPLIAAAAMYLTVRGLHPEQLDLAVLRLSHDVLVGATVFTTTLIALWLLAGRPEGGEATVLRQLSSRLRSLRGAVAQ